MNKNQKEEFDKLWDEDGKYYIAYGRDYRAVGNGGKTWQDQKEIMERFVEKVLQEH